MDFVVDQAAAGLDGAAKQLMQGAFARGKLLALLDIACMSCLHSYFFNLVIKGLFISVAGLCIVRMLCPHTLAIFWELLIEQCAYLQPNTALST